MSTHVLAHWRINRRWTITWERKLADCWIGVYWQNDPAYFHRHVWICLVPCLPIHIWRER